MCLAPEPGWHYDCLDPPLEGPPEGNWNCPQCPPLPEPSVTYEDDEGSQAEGEDLDVSLEVDGDESQPQASTSATTSTPRSRPKSKSKSKSKSRPKTSSSTSKSKGKARARVRIRPTVAASVIPRTPASTNKKARPSHSHRGPGRPPGSLNHNTRTPTGSTSRPGAGGTSEPKVTFRLRLSRGKNGGEDEDEVKKSPFEDFLAPEEYDTSKSVIIADDKGRFERSRIAAEVCFRNAPAHFPLFLLATLRRDSVCASSRPFLPGCFSLNEAACKHARIMRV